eukprot:10315011-Prorocentrum_lima.AAC.1
MESPGQAGRTQRRQHDGELRDGQTGHHLLPAGQQRLRRRTRGRPAPQKPGVRPGRVRFRQGQRVHVPRASEPDGVADPEERPHPRPGDRGPPTVPRAGRGVGVQNVVRVRPSEPGRPG